MVSFQTTLPMEETAEDMRRLKTNKEINIYRFQFILNYLSKKTPSEKLEYIFSELALSHVSYQEFVTVILRNILS